MSSALSGVLNYPLPSAVTLTVFFHILKGCNDNSIDDGYNCYDGTRIVRVLIISSSYAIPKNLGQTSASTRNHKSMINVTMFGNLF